MPHSKAVGSFLNSNKKMAYLMISLQVLGIIAGVVVLVVVFTYNSIISLKNDVARSWAGIDVQLKRRTDLIPNLVSTVQGYAKHEKQLFESIATARSSLISSQQSKNVSQAAVADSSLTDSLKTVFAVAEKYPDLKANEHFLRLQKELSQTENQIAASRRIYNENVTLFNTTIETFPNNVFASVFGFKSMQLFEATTEEKQIVNVKVGTK